MIYVTEIPGSDQISNLYKQYGAFKQCSQFAPSHFSWWDLKKNSSRDLHIAILAASGGLQGHSLIEIGCSFGRFLELAKHCGASVAGVEPDEHARSHLKHLDIPCHKSLPITDKASIICAFHVLEHLETPGELLAQVSASLTDDGRLILAMPNGGEQESIGSSWIGFRVDLEHLNYFSAKTIALILRKHGMILEQFWLHKQPALTRGKPSTTCRVLGSYWLGKLVNRLTKCPQTSWLCESGSFTLTVMARKFSAIS
jgi:2-polyprenyl-3-methyl-5-hydroxy-6-metoxy-1,4-benzoquinol methylase